MQTSKTSRACGRNSYINKSGDARQGFLNILALDVFNWEAEGYQTHCTRGTRLLLQQQSGEALHCIAHLGCTPATSCAVEPCVPQMPGVCAVQPQTVLQLDRRRAPGRPGQSRRSRLFSVIFCPDGQSSLLRAALSNEPAPAGHGRCHGHGQVSQWALLRY